MRMKSTNTQREMMDTATTFGGPTVQSFGQYFHVSPMKQSYGKSLAVIPMCATASQLRNRRLIAKMKHVIATMTKMTYGNVRYPRIPVLPFGLLAVSSTHRP
jgi:hypothetical protein